VRVGAVQYKPRKGAPADALRELAALASKVGKADLIVLPEMCSTGYVFRSPEQIRPFAEAPDGPTFQALSPVAKAQRCWLVAGFVEDAGDRLFNSALILDPAGERRFVYRKTLLYDADVPWATPGDSGYPRFETDGGAFTAGICMDLNDDRFVAHCASAGVRAVAMPTNWLEEGEQVWPYWAWRMLPVNAALVAANTYGPEEDIAFCGSSAILDRNVVLAAAPPSGNAAIRARLSP
jgi:predicted amidohydrolase